MGTAAYKLTACYRHTLENMGIIENLCAEESEVGGLDIPDVASGV